MKVFLKIILFYIALPLSASIPVGILKPGAPFGAGSLARDVVMQSDGKFVACGYTTVSGVKYFTVARFTSTGALDKTFNANNTYPGVIQEKGFGTAGNQQAFALVINSIGKIIVVGLAGGSAQWTLIQYNNDGSRDTGFGPNNNGVVQTGDSSSYASAIALDPANEKIFVVGYTNSKIVTQRYSTTGFLEVTSSGSATPTSYYNVDNLYGIAVNGTGVFIAYTYSSGYILEMQNDDNLTYVIANNHGSYSQFGLGIITQYDRDIRAITNTYSLGFATESNLVGSPGFNICSRPAGFATKYSSAGDLVISTTTTSSAIKYMSACDNNKYPLIAQVASNGAIATGSFGSTDGVINTSGIVKETTLGPGFYSAIALQKNGKIITVGWSTEFQWIMARYNSNGSRDTTFNGIDYTGLLQDTASPFNTSLAGLILTTTIDQSGSIVVGGFYGNNATAVRYTTSAGRDGNFGNNGVTVLTSLAPTSSINKIINAADNRYLATGASATGGQIATVSLTSTGTLNMSFNGTGYVQETTISGPSGAFDLLLNGTALAVAGVTQTNIPSVLNYNSLTGVRNSTLGVNGYQNYSSLGIGSMCAITSSGGKRYGAGQVANAGFVKILPSGGVLQDVLLPFNTSLAGLILTTTIDQSGKIVVGGFYGNNATAVRYTTSAGRDGTFGSNGVTVLTSLAPTSSINKIINAADNGYLATGASATGGQIATVSLTSSGILNTIFNGIGYVQETTIPGPSAGYDLLLNGTALAVAGVTQINSPSVINYNSSTGARNALFKSNGYQQFPELGTGSINAIAAEGVSRYGAGRGTNNDTAFVKLLVNGTGVLQDRNSPFDTSLAGLILTTTIGQSGSIVVGGFYGNNATAVRYTTSAGRDGDFGSNGVTVLTSLAPTSSINKIINAADNRYLATGASAAGGQIVTVSLTSTGTLNTTFNGTGYVQETTIPGPSAGYDLLLNGTALAVAGVTQINSPSVINYNSSTGARNASFKSNGYQQFPELGTGSINGINVLGISRYGAGRGTNNNTAFVKLLVNGTGILQDTAVPFNTGANGLLYTTTLDQSGNIVVGGQYSNIWEVISYLPTAARNTTFGGSGNGVAAAPFGVGGRVRSLALDSTGQIVATGASQDGPNEVFTTVRYNNTGSSSSYIKESLLGAGSGLGLNIYTDNSFDIAGFTTTGGLPTPTVINYTPAFTQNFISQFPSLATGYFFAIQTTANGSKFVAGASQDTALLYELLDGTGLLLDRAAPFNTGYNGVIYSGLFDNARSSLVLCGNYNNIFTIVRYTSTGHRNPFYAGNNGVLQNASLNAANGYAIIQDSAGNYYVAASSTVGGNFTFTVVKYTNAGVLDATFGNGGVIQEINLGIGKATAITINNGTLFVGGQTTVNGTLLPTLIAYTTDGQRLATFGTNGVQTYPNFGEGILNNVTVVNISTIASAGQMGDVATIVQLGQSNNLVDQINNGF